MVGHFIPKNYMYRIKKTKARYTHLLKILAFAFTLLRSFHFIRFYKPVRISYSYQVSVHTHPLRFATKAYIVLSRKLFELKLNMCV